MARVLPFAQYRVFEPSAADAMGQAFDAAWERVRAAASDPVTSYWEEQTRERLAARIIARMQAGESDPVRLRDDAIAYGLGLGCAPEPVPASARRGAKPVTQRQQERSTPPAPDR